MSVDVFCYLELPSPVSNASADLKVAIRPLGPPLTKALPWTKFHEPLSKMINHIPGLNDEMRHEFTIFIEAGLKAKYLAQPRFDRKVPVYGEEDLRKRATDVNSPIQQVGLNPPPTLTRPGDDTVPTNPPKKKKELLKKYRDRKARVLAHVTSSKSSTTHSDDGHESTEVAKTTKTEKESDDQIPTPNLLLTKPVKLREDTFSSVKPSPGLSSLTQEMDSMLGKKRKNEEPHIGLPHPPSRQEPSAPSSAPTGPKKWSYFDNYHILPPQVPPYRADSRSQERPSTGHWKSRQIAPSRQIYDC